MPGCQQRCCTGEKPKADTRSAVMASFHSQTKRAAFGPPRPPPRPQQQAQQGPPRRPPATSQWQQADITDTQQPASSGQEPATVQLPSPGNGGGEDFVGEWSIHTPYDASKVKHAWVRDVSSLPDAMFPSTHPSKAGSNKLGCCATMTPDCCCRPCVAWWGKRCGGAGA